MKRLLIRGAVQGLAIVVVITLFIAIVWAADILTVDKDGVVRLRVSETGKVTLNTNEPAQGDMRFTSRTADPTAPLAGDLWYNDAVKEVKYADGGLTKPLATMTDGALSLYVNGTTGDDSNSGLTSGTAVKTIQKAVNLVPPIVRHAVTINVAAGTYRDLGATVGGVTCNVYIADKVVTASGSIVLQGSATLAGASGYRVTGSNSGADTTPVRSCGFYVGRVANVNVRGLQCDRYTRSGIWYDNGASGAPLNCICDNNNVYGIEADRNSAMWLSTCQANTNGSCGVFYDRISFGSVSSCTTNSNYYFGIAVYHESYVNISGCQTSLNGTTGSGYGYGILYYVNSSGNTSNCTSPSGNNQSGGLRGEYGVRVDYTLPMPNSNDATGSASSEVF